jgi:mono/diheme cytochrome c family protein
VTRPIGDPNVDVEMLHRAAAHPSDRELAEPTEGTEPTPWWMWVLAVGSLFVGGFYLGRHVGTFSAKPHTGFTSAQEVSKRPELVRAPSGAELFASRCASCHQADAKGLPGTYPPLVGSEWVRGNPEILVRIVLLGLSGPLEVAGQHYNGQMPSWESLLTDPEIASILSHVRGLSDAPPIDDALVGRVRQATAGSVKPMSTEDLQKLAKEAR